LETPASTTGGAGGGGGGGGDERLARLVLSASDRLYYYDAPSWRGGGDGCGGGGVENDAPEEGWCASTTTTTDEEEEDDDDAWTLSAYLRSLPWMGCAGLTRGGVDDDDEDDDDDDERRGGGSATTSKDNRVVCRLRLDIGDALGDPPPAFSRLASMYGTMTAYHGTKIERAWSVLNHGLINLSHDNSLSQNGAMLGDGVYLTTSVEVAAYFARCAAQRPPRSLEYAFNHLSLLNLLSAVAGIDVSRLDPLDCYDIACLPVFEATIIKPPPPSSSSSLSKDKSGHSHAKTDPAVIATGGNRHTRQDGKYYVCPDGDLVRITGLHLTIELTRKSSSLWRSSFLAPILLPLSLIVLLLAMNWTMR
jgi:hypothetical protein